ncbi:MAG: DUF1232 domain-containing protein [Deltaproteobacteria bacterium]|nr:DUF1232 domain-containing protein [Deltaproteobacteria bacterium]
MGDLDIKYLDIFPSWLRTLGEDAQKTAALINEPSLSENARRAIVGGINYLFKSLDLIPDGIDDIGYLDDAFVLRVSADLATREEISGVEPENLEVLNRLAGECEVVREFLADNYPRLESYVKGLYRGAARGRYVSDILENRETCSEFISDIREFGQSYRSPSFAREEKNLIKLQAFFDAKLPR